MWYQFSSEDSFVLIGSARARIREIDILLRRRSLRPADRHALGVERNCLLRLIDSLYDDGYLDCLVCNPHRLDGSV